jgi:hypothetical protein
MLSRRMPSHGATDITRYRRADVVATSVSRGATSPERERHYMGKLGEIRVLKNQLIQPTIPVPR